MAATIGCGVDPRQASLAVNTGWRPNPLEESWASVIDREVVVHRDNPPLQGWTQRLGGTFLRRTEPDGFPQASLTGGTLGAFVWDRANARVDWSIARGDVMERGELGVTQLPDYLGRPSLSASDYAFGRFEVESVRWRSNGLQLRPGEIANIQLKRRVYDPAKSQWRWDYPAGAFGRLRLAPNTRLVAIAVGVLRIDGEVDAQSATRLTADDAAAWFDGRAVEIQQSSSTSGGNLNEVILDRDPRPLWRPENFFDAGAGRPIRAPNSMQEPDNVWSQCGARFDLGVQFRVVRYVPIRVQPEQANTCHTIARTGGGAGFMGCFNRWITALLANVDGPAIPIIVMPRYTQSNAVAEAFGSQIVVGLADLLSDSRPHRENIVAHELGHTLGPSSPFFNDGFVDPAEHPFDNLMANHANRLSRGQCQVAYSTAGQFLAP